MAVGGLTVESDLDSAPGGRTSETAGWPNLAGGVLMKETLSRPWGLATGGLEAKRVRGRLRVAF